MLTNTQYTELEDAVETVFNQNCKVYGSRKIKVTLERKALPSFGRLSYQPVP
jgi:hypothetical protein